MHPVQLRAARAISDLTLDELATASGVGRATLQRIESGQAPRKSTSQKIRAALRLCGVEIVSLGDCAQGLGATKFEPVSKVGR